MPNDIIAQGLALKTNRSMIRRDLKAKVLRTLAAARANNPWTLPAMASPPTISAASSTQQTGVGEYPVNITQQLYTRPELINHLGCQSINTGSALKPVTVTRPGPVTSAASGVIEFMHDGRAFGLSFQNSQIRFLLEVDGQFASKTLYSDSVGGAAQYVTVDFGTRALRRIRVFTISPVSLLYYGPSERVFAPATNEVVRTIVCGDSYIEGTGASNPLYSLGNVFGYMSGLRDVRASGIGGTGYLAPGAYWKWRDHITDITGINPDMVVWALGTNDGSYSSATITAEALACYQAVRAACPNAIQIVLGPWAQNTGPSGAMTTIENALINAVAQMADPMTVYAPVNLYGGTLITPDAWISGTGKSGSSYSGPLTFTGGLAGATSATLNAAFTGPTASLYTVRFSDGTEKTGVTLTNGSTAISWSGAVTAGTAAWYRHATAGNAGPADVYQGGSDGTDGVHPNNAGHDYLGRRMFDAVAAAVTGLNV